MSLYGYDTLGIALLIDARNQAMSNTCEGSIPFASLDIPSGWYSVVSSTLILEGLAVFETTSAELYNNPEVDMNVYIPFTAPLKIVPVLTSLTMTQNDTLVIVIGVDDFAGIVQGRCTALNQCLQHRLTYRCGGM
jgi:hypothetical protein